MARLARSGASELLIYRIAENAAADAFRNHEHTGGGFTSFSRARLQMKPEFMKPATSYFWIANRATPRAQWVKQSYWFYGLKACASSKLNTRLSQAAAEDL